MTFREACSNDIAQIQLIRNAVTENMLSDPSLVTDADCADFINRRGKGWVCEENNRVLGFAIADFTDCQITVSDAIAIAASPETANIHHSTAIL